MVARVKASTTVPSIAKSNIDSEARLKALEDKVFSPEEIPSGINERLAALEARFDALISFLNENSYITANSPKNSEGKRQFKI